MEKTLFATIILAFVCVSVYDLYFIYPVFATEFQASCLVVQREPVQYQP